MLVLWLPPDLSPLWEMVPELPQTQLILPSLDSPVLATLVLTAILAGWGFVGSGSVYCVCISIG